jgi:formylglycine-generating enzyme required for sulfatase activity
MLKTSDGRRYLPEMVTVPAGIVTMGSREDEVGRLPVEAPQHAVRIGKPLTVAKFTVTVDQFAAFIESSGHRLPVLCQTWDGTTWVERAVSFMDPGFMQAGDHPAVCVGWDDARAYARWLSQLTGEPYRLLSEAEWEYAARAGSASRYWWGDTADPSRANCKDPAGQLPAGTVPVDCFEPNPWGLHQMHGNVWEWVEDCYRPDYQDAAGDGRACDEPADCAKRVLRGGGWRNGPNGIRSARRHAARPDFRRGDVGFRVALTGTPRSVIAVD